MACARRPAADRSLLGKRLVGCGRPGCARAESSSALAVEGVVTGDPGAPVLEVRITDPSLAGPKLESSGARPRQAHAHVRGRRARHGRFCARPSGSGGLGHLPRSLAWTCHRANTASTATSCMNPGSRRRLLTRCWWRRERWCPLRRLRRGDRASLRKPCPKAIPTTRRGRVRPPRCPLPARRRRFRKDPPCTGSGNRRYASTKRPCVHLRCGTRAENPRCSIPTWE